eukprot:144903-Chlamydomonas_euryale.AAC.5
MYEEGTLSVEAVLTGEVCLHWLHGRGGTLHVEDANEESFPLSVDSMAVEAESAEVSPTPKPEPESGNPTP